MPTNNDAVAAVPISGQANKTLLRDLLTARFAYIIFDDEDVTDFVALDPETAAATIDILYLGRTFHYDPTDTTTANDGISCLVTHDGRRYKLSDGSDVFAYSVLDNTLTAPPVSPGPVIGDAYLITAGATGAWTGKANYIGVFTRRGWEFINFGIGRFIYVESVDTYYHRNSGGTWVSGFGNNTFNDESIPLSAAINFGARVIVENQTTSAPPGSPSLGDAYVIGPAPTGAWAGAAAQIAICQDGSTFTIYDVGFGWVIYDKAQNADFKFTGTSWISLQGAWRSFKKTAITTTGSIANAGTNGYAFDATTAPATTDTGQKDLTTLAYAASRTGAALRFSYSCSFTGGSASTQYTLGLFRDSDVNALAWISAVTNAGGVYGGTVQFNIDSADTSSHTYYVRAVRTLGVNEAGLAHRQLTIEEAF